mmetsp:Transcript_19628/g.45698  ORF Transcript_19628/g.45698 Transcript_19628/m.45698 type:complete len:1506 (+) Transcript_19628:77-4594(+)
MLSPDSRALSSATSPPAGRQWLRPPETGHDLDRSSAIHSVSTHDVLLGVHPDLDTITDGGSTVGGSALQLPIPRLPEDPKSPATQTSTELSHFQTNLFNDQLGSLMRELHKVKQEMAAVRAEADGASTAREKGDAEVMKIALEVKQGVASQIDTLEREVKAVKRNHAQDVDEFKASMHQSQATTESELRRLCIAVDGSARGLDMLGTTVDKEVADRTAANDALTSKVDSEVQALTATLQEQQASQEQVIGALQDQLQKQSEAMERQREELVKALASATCDLRQEAETQGTAIHGFLKEMRQALQKEVSDRAEEAAQIAQRAAESLQQEREERCSSGDALRKQMSSLSASVEASRIEDKQSLASSSASLREQLLQEVRDLQLSQANFGAKFEDLLEMRRREANQGLADLQNALAEQKSLVESHHRAVDDGLRENSSSIASIQASMNNRLIEEQAIREQNMNAFQSSLEAVDVKYSGKLLQLCNDQTAHKAELRDLVGEHKRHVDAQQSQMKESLSYDKMSREKEQNALRDNLNVQLREECIRLKEEVQTGYAAARDLVNKVASEHQAAQSKLREALTEQKVHFDNQQAALQGSLAEEKAAREQATRNLQASVTVLDGKFNEELLKLSSMHENSTAALQDRLGKQAEQLEQHVAAIDKRFLQAAAESQAGNSQVQEALLEQKVHAEAKQAALQGSLAEETAAREQSSRSMQTSLADLEQKVHEELMKLSAANETSYAAMQDQLGQQSSQLEQHVASTDKRFQEDGAARSNALSKMGLEMQARSETGDAKINELTDKVSAMESSNRQRLQDVRDSLQGELTRLHQLLVEDQGALMEERSCREEASRSLQANVEGLQSKFTEFQARVEASDAKLKSEVSSLAADSGRCVQELRTALEGEQGRLHELLVADQGSLGQERAARELSTRTLETSIANVEGKVTEELRTLISQQQEEQKRLREQLASELQDMLHKEKEDREIGRCSLQVAFEELDTRVREDLDRMSADACGMQEVVRQATSSLESQVSSMRVGMTEMSSTVEENRVAVQAMSTSLAERLKENQTTLWDQVEKERVAREAGLGNIRDFWGQMDQKLHGIRMEMRDAIQELEQKSHAVRLEERDRVESLDMKLQEEIDSVATEQRAGHSILQGQITEVQSKVDTMQSSVAGQLQEERTMRESHASRLHDRVEKVEKRLTVGLEQEAADREASSAQLRQQMQQQETMQREDLRCEIKAEMTKLWDAVNNHTHDVNAMTTHKVTTNKQSQQSQNNVSMKGAQGMGFRSISPGPSHGPAIHALADLHQQAALPAIPSAPAQGSRSLAIEGPVQRSQSGPLHAVKITAAAPPQGVQIAARSSSTARTPRASAATPVALTPQGAFVPQSEASHHAYMQPPAAAGGSSVFVHAPQPTTPRTHSVAVLPPSASNAPTPYMPGTGSEPRAATPVKVHHYAPAQATPPHVAACGGMCAMQATHDTSGTVHQEHSVDTTEELHKLACGPAMYAGHNSTSNASIRS